MAKKQNYYYVLVFTNHGPVYVTEVDYRSKTAMWDKDKKPLEMTREAAKDLHFGLSINFTHCVVVNTMYELETQPYRYDAYDFTFTERENKDEN